MNRNFKVLSGVLCAAAFSVYADSAVYAQEMPTPGMMQNQTQGKGAASPGMGMPGSAMAEKSPAGGPMAMGDMGMMNMMGMMRMCPMMGGMMGHMMGGPGAGMMGPGMMGYGGLILTDKQIDRVNSVREDLFRKETALMRQMLKARLEAQKNIYAVLTKEQKEQLGHGGGMMGR